LIDVASERGKHQLQGLGIAFLERRVENRTGFGAELWECLRSEGLVALVEVCGAVGCRRAAVTEGEQTHEQGRQKQRGGGKSGAWPAGNRHPPGRGCLRRDLAAARSRDGRAAQGAGEGDAAGNEAPHRAAEPADEARTSPLVGLGGKAGDVERSWH